jgi:hypothetical protein
MKHLDFQQIGRKCKNTTSCDGEVEHIKSQNLKEENLLFGGVRG